MVSFRGGVQRTRDALRTLNPFKKSKGTIVEKPGKEDHLANENADRDTAAASSKETANSSSAMIRSTATEEAEKDLCERSYSEAIISNSSSPCETDLARSLVADVLDSAILSAATIAVETEVRRAESMFALQGIQLDRLASGQNLMAFAPPTRTHDSGIRFRKLNMPTGPKIASAVRCPAPLPPKPKQPSLEKTSLKPLCADAIPQNFAPPSLPTPTGQLASHEFTGLDVHVKLPDLPMPLSVLEDTDPQTFKSSGLLPKLEVKPVLVPALTASVRGEDKNIVSEKDEEEEHEATVEQKDEEFEEAAEEKEPEEAGEQKDEIENVEEEEPEKVEEEEPEKVEEEVETSEEAKEEA